MNKPIKDLQHEVEELLKQGQDGTLDFTTCITKVARKVLEQENCDLMMHTLIAGMLGGEGTMMFGCVLHVMMLRILRLEDDVRVLRGELAKDRIERIERIERIGRTGESGEEYAGEREHEGEHAEHAEPDEETHAE